MSSSVSRSCSYIDIQVCSLASSIASSVWETRAPARVPRVRTQRNWMSRIRQRRRPLSHLGMSRGDGECACGREWCRDRMLLYSRVTREESKINLTYLVPISTNKPANRGLPVQLYFCHMSSARAPKYERRQRPRNRVERVLDRREPGKSQP